MKVIIEEMVPQDWDEVAAIYLAGIKTGKATFQTGAPSWEDWDHSHLKLCRLVARAQDGSVMGWMALSPSSSRCVYQGVVEVSIYIGEQYRGNGVGSLLLHAGITKSEEHGFWTLYSVIVRENEASIKLHKKCGFRIVGIREKIAKMPDGIWHDTVLMERRSKVVGVSSALDAGRHAR